LTATLEATKELPDELAALEERCKAKQERLDTVNTAIRELAFNPARLESLREAHAEAEAAVDEARDRCQEARLEAQSSDQAVAELRRRVEEAELAQAAIEAHVQKVREHDVAARLLADFRAAQHQRAWPKLERGAGELLSTTTDGRYADVRLTKDYKLEIVDRGERHGLERYSGGEQDLANLCLRLSIADWVARERDAELGFVILDEVFGSQDEDRRERLLAALRSLENRFHQLLVITHVGDIADLCDHQLQVRLEAPGRSSAGFAA
jgi:exonuclease SbcC